MNPRKDTPVRLQHAGSPREAAAVEIRTDIARRVREARHLSREYLEQPRAFFGWYLQEQEKIAALIEYGRMLFEHKANQPRGASE